MSIDRSRITSFATHDGSVQLVCGDLPAYEGPLDEGAWLRLGMSIGPAARVRLRSDNVRLDDNWRPGTLCLTPPSVKGECSTSAVRFLGLAVSVAHGASAGWTVPSLDRLHRLASAVHRDDLIAAVLTALWQTALVHGPDDDFIEHGTRLVLDRLGALDGGLKTSAPAVRPLSPQQVRRVEQWVDDRISADVSVADMATVAGLSPSGFSKALALATGYTPYAWLVRRRVQHAEALLRSGHSVTEAAIQVGYSNPSKFAAAFRRMTGATPTRWIALQRCQSGPA